MFFNQCVKKPCHELLQCLWEKESFTFLDCYHLCEFPRVAFDAELFNISLACEVNMLFTENKIFTDKNINWSPFYLGTLKNNIK
ncbi:hypothetical protein T4C_4371 [Trichinella pseudospiralis]|uniref:Uncharacterized protein n=1 Tax=Trichinella pseudospiralis TaxID=6337 RepID=A0A0V1JYB7_TRIPS|nr:hypothetical protein T4C_4371 [Trichinella pseudospiralis]